MRWACRAATCRCFERPHTESNYLTREMGFVVARKHAKKLRTIAVVLFALIPALCALPVWLLPHGDAVTAAVGGRGRRSSWARWWKDGCFSPKPSIW